MSGPSREQHVGAAPAGGLALPGRVRLQQRVPSQRIARGAARAQATTSDKPGVPSVEKQGVPAGPAMGAFAHRAAPLAEAPAPQPAVQPARQGGTAYPWLHSFYPVATVADLPAEKPQQVGLQAC